MHQRTLQLLMILVLAATLISLPSPGSARPVLMERVADGNLRLSLQYQHVIHPNPWDDDVDYTAALELGTFLPISKGLSLVFDLPISIATTSYYDPYWGSTSASDKEVNLGNAYLGIGLNPDHYKSKLSFNAGIYLPTGSTELPWSAWYATYQQPKFSAEYLTLHLNVGRKFSKSDGTYLALELGPDFMTPTGDNNSKGRTLLNYGVGVGIDSHSMHIGAEFTGTWDLSGDDDFSRESYHALGMSIEYKAKSIQPALFYTVPTDQVTRYLIDGIVGVRITVTP